MNKTEDWNTNVRFPKYGLFCGNQTEPLIGGYSFWAFGDDMMSLSAEYYKVRQDDPWFVDWAHILEFKTGRIVWQVKEDTPNEEDQHFTIADSIEVDGTILSPTFDLYDEIGSDGPNVQWLGHSRC